MGTGKPRIEVQYLLINMALNIKFDNGTGFLLYLLNGTKVSGWIFG